MKPSCLERITRSVSFKAAIGCLSACWATAQVTVEYNASGDLRQIRATSARPPTLLMGPDSVVATPGQNTAFSVLSTGTPRLGYQWVFNGNAIVDATGDSLLLTNLTLGNFGNYHVIVTNAFGSATSAVARLELDSDGDGLADSWELTYFGSLTNQSGAFDRDNDGVSNLAEFREGSNPTNGTSLFPRLSVQAYRCSVAVSPWLEKYTNGQVVLLTATPHPGESFIQWTGATNSTSTVVTVTMTTNKSLTAQAGLPLADSLDITNRVNTSGNVAWFGQSADSKDGIDAARSGRMGHNQVSWFQITNNMSGEGTVSFWWKVASQQTSDNLRFFINTAQKPGQISGFTDWHQKTYYLTSGVHTVRWEYLKNQNDGSVGDGISLNSQGGTNAFASGPYPGIAPADAGWVDRVVFEVYANPLRDTDGDGLADLWEYRFFYSLDQDAGGDPDNDEISNRDEFLEGTDPTSNASLKPRLTLLSEGAGTVSAIPSKLKYNYAEIVTNSAIPFVSNFFVMWTGAMFSTNANAPLTMFGNRTVKGVFGFGIGEALEAPSLAWTRGGTAGWYGQTNVAHDGVDAARSAPVNFGQESWMETTVSGPGLLSFWWKVSSLANLNTLRLNLNGIEQAYRISGEVDWEEQFYSFGPGTHTLRWRFVRNNYTATSDDAGWVDQITFTPGAVAPVIRSQPSDRTALQGSNLTLAASAVGTPTLLYEWLRNGTSLGTASTNSSFTITNLALAHSGGGYAVRVSNTGGTTTGAPFTITVLPVPPVNDNFSSRSSFSASSNAASGYNFGATRETGEPSHAGYGGSRSVWWSWVAPQSGLFRLHASSQGLSSLLLGVYTGGTVNALVPVASDQSYGSFSNSTYYAEGEALFSAVTNTGYAFAVDTDSGDAGWIQLAITNVPPVPLPPNDLFANRIVLPSSNIVATGHNTGATAEPGEPDHTGFGGLGGPNNSVWWAWSPPRSGTARLDARGTTFSPVIAVYSGASVTSLNTVASGFFTPQLDFAAVRGVSYAIAFDGYSGATGDFQFVLGMLSPVIEAPVLVPGALQMTLSGLPGASYVLQRSTNLTAWSSVSTNTLPPSGRLTLTEPRPPNDPARFYRMVIQ